MRYESLLFTKKELKKIRRIIQDFDSLIKTLEERKKPLGGNLTLFGCVSFVNHMIMDDILNDLIKKVGAK